MKTTLYTFRWPKRKGFYSTFGSRYINLVWDKLLESNVLVFNGAPHRSIILAVLDATTIWLHRLCMLQKRLNLVQIKMLLPCNHPSISAEIGSPTCCYSLAFR